MKLISLETTIKEIIRSEKLSEVLNSLTHDMFKNPNIKQAETMSLLRISSMLGQNGKTTMEMVVSKANEILKDLPDEEEIDYSQKEIDSSLGLEYTISDEERKKNAVVRNKIEPGKIAYDTDGKRIQAHGASVFIEGDTYYWIGENKDHTTKEGDIWTWGVKIYSSKDLYNWTDLGYLVEPVLNDNKSVFYPIRRLDRPHLLYNESTKKYVLWLKFLDKAHYTILTSDTLLGKYEVIKEEYYPYGAKCGDFDLAIDNKTKEGYLFFEVNHEDVWAAKLNEEYTEVVGDYKKIYENIKPPYTREAVCHMERNGLHYIFTSGMSGYVPNPSEVCVSNDFLGDYKVLGNPHVDDDSMSSFNSQISHIFKVIGKDEYISIADRWVPEFVMTKERYDIIERVISSNRDKSIKVTDEERKAFSEMPMMGTANTSIANYVWLPIEFVGDVPAIKWYNEWKLK